MSFVSKPSAPRIVGTKAAQVLVRQAATEQEKHKRLVQFTKTTVGKIVGYAQ